MSEEKHFDEEYFEKLDKLLNVATINLYTISKEDGIIRFSHVDLNNDKHWALLNVVSHACAFMGRTAYLDISLWQYIKLRHRFHTKKMKRVKNNGGMTCDKFISDIEEANKSLIVDPFLDIAKNYYPRRRKQI